MEEEQAKWEQIVLYVGESCRILDENTPRYFYNFPYDQLTVIGGHFNIQLIIQITLMSIRLKCVWHWHLRHIQTISRQRKKLLSSPIIYVCECVLNNQHWHMLRFI